MILRNEIIINGVPYNRVVSSDGVKVADESGNEYDEAIYPASVAHEWKETDKPTGEGFEPMRYSRWGIIKALEKRGLADAFDAYLDSNKAAFRRFYGPTNFRADDADFKDMLKTLQGAFSLTDADIAAILAESPYIED